jgi:hypothetical protein
MRIQAILLVLSLATAAASWAQPRGACVLPDGRWCWPDMPASAGSDCVCQTSTGAVTGRIQG